MSACFRHTEAAAGRAIGSASTASAMTRGVGDAAAIQPKVMQFAYIHGA